MDLKRVERAIAAYGDALTDEDRARLAFFEELWAVAERSTAAACEPGSCADAGWEASEEEAADAARRGVPLFSVAPARIDAHALAQASASLAESACRLASYPDDLARALRSIDWDSAFADAGFDRAGREPEAFLAALADALESRLGFQVAFAAASLASIALKAQIEPQAARAFEALTRSGAAGTHPIACPVCGGTPSLAHVGPTSASGGRGRRLVCPHCATAWDFDRIRCARCGSRNQEALHLHSVEDDDAHFISVCDECGGYIRTVYSDGGGAAVCYEVEDVVMAKLDAIALEGAYGKDGGAA